MRVNFKIFFLMCFFFSSSAFSEEKKSNLYLETLANDMVLGKDKANVTIIEYSSFSCPHCAYFHKNVFDSLKTKYIDTGKLKYIHRDYPLDKAAFAGSVLAHCGGVEKYFTFLKVLFEKQENWVFQKNYLEILENIAKLGGMSSEKFHQCLADKNVEKSILESRMIASNNLNVSATPTFFINGKIYPGMHNLEFFEKAINTILQENK